jgi:hypothetical protein
MRPRDATARLRGWAARLPLPGPAPRVARSEALVLIAWVVLATGAQLLRQKYALSVRTVWAEDGSVFLNDALRHGLAHNVVQPYAGYVDFGPRLLGQLAAALPIGWAAGLFAVSAALVVSLVSAYVYVATGAVLGSRVLRATLAALAALLPAAGWEATANLSNTHWFLVFGTFWALLCANGGSRALRWGGAAIAVFGALADPLAILLVPLAGLVALRAPRLRDATVPIALVLAVVGQWALRSGADTQLTHLGLTHLPGIFGTRVAGSLLVGEHWLFDVHDALGTVLPVLASLVVAAGCVFALRRPGAPRTVAALAIAYAVGLLAISVYLRGSPDMAETTNGSRYVLEPILLLAGALAIAADGARRAWTAWAVAGVAAVGVVSSLRVFNARSAGPTWSVVLAQGRARCARGARDVSLVVSPSPGRFRVRAPCSKL